MKRKILACLLSLSLLILTIAPATGSFASEVGEIPTAGSLTGEVEDVPATVEPTSQAAEVTQAVPEEKSTPEPTP